MSGLYRVWLVEAGEAGARCVRARSAADAAQEVGEEYVAEGAAAIGGDGVSFDVLVRDDVGDLTRHRAVAPPVFLLESVECCRGCGVDSDEDADDTLCSRCAEAA